MRRKTLLILIKIYFLFIGITAVIISDVYAVKQSPQELLEKSQPSGMTIQDPACLNPIISAVVEKRYYPQMPIIIFGCGFGSQAGKVKMSKFNIELVINGWTNRSIGAKIPSVIPGLTEKTKVNLTVETYEGKTSQPSSKSEIWIEPIPAINVPEPDFTPQRGIRR